MSSPGATRDDLLPIGDIAARSGLAPSAIRFYEAEGLIRAERTGGGRRAFLGTSFGGLRSSRLRSASV